jgi:hypothetical protein
MYNPENPSLNYFNAIIMVICFLQATVFTTERERPAAMKILNKAIPAIFGNLTSMFLTTSATNILFDGIPIYCNVTDFSSKAVCSEIRKRKNEFQQLDENIYGFSFFGIVSICISPKMHESSPV